MVSCFSNNGSPPTITRLPSTTPTVPMPAIDSKWPTPARVPSSLRAALAMAFATGCSLACSKAPAKPSTSARVTPVAHTTSMSCMTPVVTVPVLSNTTVSTRRVLCKTSTPLITIPICAARPLPTIKAVGVARPSAHGHAMISTATAAVNESATRLTLSPSTYQPMKVRIEIAITVGTNTLLTLSAKRCTGAFVDCASRTSLVICANVESAPTRRAFTMILPERFTVVPVTLLPFATSTGTLSPVSIDASIVDSPSCTIPSAAMISPGRTTIKSPTLMSAASITTSSPSRNTVALRAPSARSARSASPARRFARASK